MTFKIVCGLGRAEYAVKAINAAMEKMHTPEYVDRWLTWFDKQPDDSVVGDQCANCTPGVVCPDDCPQPEYYLGDLEEVAHAMVTRTESALSLLVQQMARPGSVATLAPEVKALFDGIRAEISLPGYVEGLITE